MASTKISFGIRPTEFVFPAAENSPSMSTPSCTKVPGESRLYTFNFGDYPELSQQGQTLSGTSSVASDPTGPSLGTSFVVGNVVMVNIAGGTDGVDYNLTVTAGTSGGQTIQGVAKLQVRAVP